MLGAGLGRGFAALVDTATPSRDPTVGTPQVDQDSVDFLADFLQLCSLPVPQLWRPPWGQCFSSGAFDDRVSAARISLSRKSQTPSLESRCHGAVGCHERYGQLSNLGSLLGSCL